MADRLTRTQPIPQLLKVSAVAEMLNVSPRTVLKWIEQERVPYVKLPGGEYRLPLQALLSSLGGTYDLAGALRQQDQEVLAREQPNEG
jgi:excisionase family DNA binding protein